MNQIHSHTRAAQLILEHAEAAGLPLPFNVEATEYAVSLMVRSLDDLAEWSLYMETPIGERLHKDSVQHAVVGPFLEQVIQITTVTRAAAVA